MATSSKHEDHAGTDDPGREATESEESADDAADEGADSSRGASKSPRGGAKPSGARPAAARGAQARAGGPAQGGGSLGKSMLLFLIIVGGLGAGFALLGRESGGGGSGTPVPRWKTGDKVDVEITLVASDSRDLACYAKTEVGGRHCAFEAANKAWPTGDADDKTLLRPYTTTDRVQFLAAGLWSEPALAGGKLPASRFAVKCSYSVEGKLARPGVRWSSEGAWGEQTSEWYTGLLSECRILTP